MTKNEIKKALMCCSNNDCDFCPCEGTNDCVNSLLSAALDLINTLEAENEKLRGKQ